MRALSVAIFIAAAVAGTAIYEAEHKAVRKVERHYIYGFGIRRASPDFWDYVPPVTAEGLREIRWDHMQRPLVVFASTGSMSAYPTVSVGSYPKGVSANLLMTTASTASGVMSCLQPAYSSIAVAR